MVLVGARGLEGGARFMLGWGDTTRQPRDDDRHLNVYVGSHSVFFYFVIRRTPSESQCKLGPCSDHAQRSGLVGPLDCLTPSGRLAVWREHPHGNALAVGANTGGAKYHEKVTTLLLDERRCVANLDAYATARQPTVTVHWPLT